MRNETGAVTGTELMGIVAAVLLFLILLALLGVI